MCRCDSCFAQYRRAAAKRRNFEEIVAALRETEEKNLNYVISLQKPPFMRQSLEEQTRIKEPGPDQPEVIIQQGANKEKNL